MSATSDIVETYERLFGVSRRASLFDADDATYQALRREILEAPRESYVPTSLPFEGIEWVSKEQFQQQEKLERLLELLTLLKRAKECMEHLFYLKREVNPTRSCDAYGYYEEKQRAFVLLKGSVLTLEMVNSFRASSTGQLRKQVVEPMCEQVENGYRLTRSCSFASPSAAASVVLGRAASGWREWVDKDGQTLRASYRSF